MASRLIDLVLQGGGIKAVAYAGGLDAIEERNIQIRKIAAVSAGSFVAVSVGIGYSSAELKELVYETDFSKFAGPVLYRAKKKRVGPRSPGAKLFREHFVFEKLRVKKGLDDGQAIMDWTAEVLKSKQFSPYATFADLPKDVRLIAYNHSSRAEMVFSRERTPNASVVDAVRASTGLVPIYEPFKWTDNNGRVYELTDGGVVNSYPIDIFNEEKDRKGLPPTIGLRLTEGVPEEEKGELLGEKSEEPETGESKEEKRGEESFFEYLINHITTSIDSQGKFVLKRSDVRKSINIYTGNIRTVDFLTIGNDKEKKQWLIRQGYQAVQEYIDYVNRFLFFPEALHGLFFEIKNFNKYVSGK